MSDELDLELDLTEEEGEKKSRVKERITKLATEKTEALKKAEAEVKAREGAEARAKELEKEMSFYKGFSNVATKYQGAHEYQDKILEKVRSGYDVEDATLAILAKEGKLQQKAPETPKESAAGGSATNSLPQGEKSVGEMSQSERKSKLSELLGG